MRKGPAPHLWKSGPDPIDNKLYTECQKRRAQAKFRGQIWLITEEEYIALWRRDDLYLRKGRGNSDLCMTLIDASKPWRLDNIKIIDRLTHYKQTAGAKKRKQHGLV